MSRQRRRSDPVNLAVASVSGITERFVRMRRATRDEAAAEIGERLTRLSAPQRQQALDIAAASYVDGEYAYEAQAIEFLAGLGADVDAARAIKAERSGQHGLDHIGETMVRQAPDRDQG